MNSATRRKLEKLHDKVRGQGGSILGPDGRNLTSDGWAPAFIAAIEASCWTDDKSIGMLAEAMENFLKHAKQIEEFNKIPTTNPKCNSMPILSLLTGCRLETNLRPRNGDESDCSGGGETPET